MHIVPAQPVVCWCGKKDHDPEKSTHVRDGIVICNTLCLSQYEKRNPQHRIDVV